MVHLSTVLLAQSRFRRKWIDSLRIYVKGGFGGTGLPGVNGLGGDGGNVYIKADERINDLEAVKRKNPRQRYIANAGENSVKQKCIGSSGENIIIRSPVGVSIVTDQGEVIGDLMKHDDVVLVARGGPGGNKSTQYLGLAGQARNVKLDLKLLADVGFVGFPNAGKSTLLKALSRAKPKIASYPFTTIQPNLGITEFDDLRKISFADLPGLIEGASYNVGMGHKFLKHVERTNLLLFVVDINGFQFKVDTPFRSALDTVMLLNKELELYKSDLLSKPALLVITKMDSKKSEEKLELFKSEYKEILKNPNLSTLDKEALPSDLYKFDEVIPISAKFSPKSVEVLKHRVRHWLDEYETRRTESNIELVKTKIASCAKQEMYH